MHAIALAVVVVGGDGGVSHPILAHRSTVVSSLRCVASIKMVFHTGDSSSFSLAIDFFFFLVPNKKK